MSDPWHMAKKWRRVGGGRGFGEMVGPRISLTQDKMQFNLACSGCRFRNFGGGLGRMGHTELAAKEFCRVLGSEHLVDELELWRLLLDWKLILGYIRCEYSFENRARKCKELCVSKEQDLLGRGCSFACQIKSRFLFRWVARASCLCGASSRLRVCGGLGIDHGPSMRRSPVARCL